MRPKCKVSKANMLQSWSKERNLFSYLYFLFSCWIRHKKKSQNEAPPIINTELRSARTIKQECNILPSKVIYVL